ncbi:MAG TPA: toxin-antitoxin system HicB family antitoxin [Blastocatellia bacterium]|nr:toxin-antitoxin system HicB family antitoxin [Blastocatellia bacterium]
MKQVKLSGKISYRISEEEEKKIQDEAAAEGVSANDWCRIAAREKLLSRRSVLSGSSRLIYEEIARVRFLTGSGFSLIAMGKLSETEWRRLLEEADESAAAIADTLLNLRETDR